MIEYIGIFIAEKDTEKIIENEKVCLAKRPKNFHCTMKYMPKDLEHFKDIIGQEVVIVLTGYGNDGKNSGYRVQLQDEINKYFLNTDKNGNLKVPHITTSLADDGKAVNTANLNFQDLEKPIFVRGRVGAFVKDENLEYISFEKTKLSTQEKA